LSGEKLACDLQTALDIAHDFARAGFFRRSDELLNCLASKERRFRETPICPTKAGAHCRWFTTRSAGCTKSGDEKIRAETFQAAAALPPDYCFPSRLEEIAILESAMRANPKDAKAPYYLGNLFYDRRRHEEAIKLWEKSARSTRFLHRLAQSRHRLFQHFKKTGKWRGRLTTRRSA
jgi:lipopolysaccharide biosynthesis regulator YciM